MLSFDPESKDYVGLNYIDGKFVGSDQTLAIDNPASGKQVAEQALASHADADRAIATARRLIDSRELIAMRPVERGRMVRKMGDFLLDNCKPIAELLAQESGKPYWEALIELEGAARYFEYYGSQADTFEGRSIPLGDSYYDLTEYEPRGISLQIIPWNFPLEMAARSLAPALTTGNACIVKTPELDPLSSCIFALAADSAGFPAGAVQILCGHGHDLGAYLAGHPGIDQIVFTGSVSTGRAVATQAARNLVPAVLELGGKSAAIVCKDTDIELLVESVRWGIFFNAGQVCSAMARLLVDQTIYSDVLDAVNSLAQHLQLSHSSSLPSETSSMRMGSMISTAQRDRALGMIQAATDGGARLTSGGTFQSQGAFLTPTVIDGVTPGMDLFQQEVFGPVLAVTPFDSPETAIRYANGTDYGLVSGVFTQQLDQALWFSKRLRSGQVFINEWFAGGVETPFGGYGKSGYGREKGREALLNYVQTKNIAFRITR